MSARTPKEMPTPTPAFAPVERPCAVVPCAAGVATEDVIAGFGIVVDNDGLGVVDTVEELELVEIACPNVCAIVLASDPPQHAVESPQHHVSDSGVPSHGVIRALPLVPSFCGMSAMHIRNP